ncbi:MAG: hypothetical protein ACLFT4_09895 [Bacteroidales bacterium]
MDKTPVKKELIKPRKIVAIADMTFFKKTFGVCVFRDANLKRNIIWKAAKTETIGIYQELRIELETRGFKFQAIVIDGRPGLFKLFSDIPIQMCHFHQAAIMTRYLTTRPKLPASQMLRRIALQIPKSNEKEMKILLPAWHKKWECFLNEKTLNEETGKWHYTHKRLRSAFRSINKNLPYLYTYQKYPHLNIPSTTNSLDGYFSHLKELIRVHRGLKQHRKLKIIDEILRKNPH